MDNIQKRLVACFSSVLPDLSTDQITRASANTVESWDSVATVTLMAVVEEEFGIKIAEGDPSRFDSFQNVLSYLEKLVLAGGEEANHAILYNDCGPGGGNS